MHTQILYRVVFNFPDDSLCLYSGRAVACTIIQRAIPSLHLQTSSITVLASKLSIKYGEESSLLGKQHPPLTNINSLISPICNTLNFSFYKTPVTNNQSHGKLYAYMEKINNFHAWINLQNRYFTLGFTYKEICAHNAKYNSQHPKYNNNYYYRHTECSLSEPTLS